MPYLVMRLIYAPLPPSPFPLPPRSWSQRTGARIHGRIRGALQRVMSYATPPNLMREYWAWRTRPANYWRALELEIAFILCPCKCTLERNCDPTAACRALPLGALSLSTLPCVHDAASPTPSVCSLLVPVPRLSYVIVCVCVNIHRYAAVASDATRFLRFLWGAADLFARQHTAASRTSAAAPRFPTRCSSRSGAGM
jgi:hypothetical protein